MAHVQTYNYVISVKMYDKTTQTTLIQTINYNMALTISYNPEEVYIGTALLANTQTVEYEIGTI